MGPMNRKELIDSIANTTGASKTDVQEILGAALDGIVAAVAKGEKVSFPGFGTFGVRERAARTGRNPQTGAEIQIAASKAPAFKAGSKLKERVSK